MAGDRYDLVVVGGGSAGLTAADFGARVGAKVLIVAPQLGGDCTWTGCIPSKTLIRIARLAHDTRQVVFDPVRVMTDVRAAVGRVFAFETPEVLANRGIDFLNESAHFMDRDTIQVGGHAITGEHFVICTGAAPNIPSVPGLEHVSYLTYENVFELNRLPASLVIVGAGPTGLELGQAFARLGSQVTILEERAALLPDADPEAAAIIQRRLESEGVSLRLSAAPQKIEADGPGVNVGVGSSRIGAESVLIAVGRRPRITGLDLERAGIDVEDGAIRVNKNLRTTNPRVYAAGDVTGGFQFTHYAGWQGYIAARNALLPGEQEGIRANVVSVLFTDPEIAQVGLTEDQARVEFKESKVHRWDLERVDRAQTEDETDGFIKLITHAGGKIVGATVVSRAAGETINELALAIERELTLSQLAATIHAYPTFGFGIQQLAAEAALEAATTGVRGKAVSALRRLS